jgi:nucleoid DNA-binding protein
MDYGMVANTLPTGGYVARVIKGREVEFDEIISEIHERTGLSPAIISAVMQATEEQLISNLSKGNTVHFGQLMTLSASLRGRFETADAVITHDTANMQLNARFHTAFENAVLAKTEFSKVAIPGKMPQIISIGDKVTGISNFHRKGSPIRISGKNLDFHEDAEEEGVFYGNTRVPFYLTAGAKRIDFVIANPVAEGDLQFVVRCKYSDDGDLREGVYTHLVREMLDSFIHHCVALTVYTITPPLVETTGQFKFRVDAQGNAFISFKPSTSENYSPELAVTQNGDLAMTVDNHYMGVSIVNYIGAKHEVARGTEVIENYTVMPSETPVPPQ